MSDVNNTNTDVYDVSPDLGSSRGGTPGFQSGDTVVAISIDGTTFTPVPQDGSDATVSGTYLSFAEDDAGDLTTSAAPGQTDQNLIDLINGNDSSSTPLSDSLYYQLQNSQGAIFTDQLNTDLGDVSFSSSGTGAYVSGGETVSEGSTTDIGGASIGKALSSDGTYGGTPADSYVLTATLSTFDFARQAPDGTIAIDPAVSGGGAVSYSSDNTSVTITGTVDQISADLSAAQFTATQTGTADIVLFATDGPVPTTNEILGSLTIQLGMAEPIASSTSTIFTVTANAGGSSQSTPNVQSGDTVLAISTDDINFTPVPSDGSTASVSGTDLTFSEDASGDLMTTVSSSQTNQAVIDAINDNDGQSTPLSDSLYYEVQDSQGNITYDQYMFDLGDVSFSYPDTGAYTPGTGETVAQGSTTDIGGPTVDKALSSDGTYGGTAADSYVLTATLSSIDFARQAPDGTTAIDPTVSGGGGSVSYSNDGGAVSVTGTIGEINADFSTAAFTATQTGTDYIIITDTDTPVPTGNQIIGSLTIDSVTPCYCPGTLILTDRGEQPVEALDIGDTVVTASGEHRPIKWIGRRSYAGCFIAGNHLMLPVTVQAGALAEGVPHTDLTTSPGHGMWVDGQLVPAWRSGERRVDHPGQGGGGGHLPACRAAPARTVAGEWGGS